MLKYFILKFLFNPQENATRKSNNITGIYRNIPPNPVDEQFGNTDNRAAPY
jgi:hypothetical protein